MKLLRRMLAGSVALPFALHASPAGATPFENHEPDTQSFDFVRKNGEFWTCRSSVEFTWQEDDETGERLPGRLAVQHVVDDPLQQDDDPYHCGAVIHVDLFWDDVDGNRFVASEWYPAYDGPESRTLVVDPAGTGLDAVRVTIEFYDCDAAVSNCTVTHVFGHK